MAFVPPLTSAPVSHLPRSIDVAECGRSPTLVKVTVAPALIRMRGGPKLYSTLLAPILTVSASAVIGPVGPATVWGRGGGHRGPRCPLHEDARPPPPLQRTPPPRCATPPPPRVLPPRGDGDDPPPAFLKSRGGRAPPKPVGNPPQLLARLGIDREEVAVGLPAEDEAARGDRRAP